MERRAKSTASRVPAFIGTLALLGGCATGPGVSSEGTWIGRLATVSGTCPTDTDSDLTITQREVLFVPADGVLTLRGLRGSDPEAFRAQLAGATIDHRTWTAVFIGRFQPGATDMPPTITATYGTPDCRATIAFHRPRDTGLRRVLGG